MADNTIDTLMLEVESNAEKSADGLDRLAASLARIGKSVSGAVTPLSSFASSIKEATTAINSLGSTREISSLLSQLTQLSKVRLDNLESKKIKIDFGLSGNEAKNLSQVADGIKNVANSMKLMNDINLKDSGVVTVINSLKRLSEVNTTNFNADGIANIAGALGSLNNINFKDTGIGTVVKSLQSLSEVDTTRFDADGIARVSNALGALGNANFKGTGLNSVIKSLRELSSVDMSNFNTGSFAGIVQSISSLGQIPDISTGINKLVSSLAKLASSGQSITTVAQQLPALGNALRDVVSRLASAESVSDAVNLFVQSLARLAGAGAKTAETAAGLETLGQATLDFFRTMQSAPQISENTLRMTEALSRLAASGANVGQATNATSNAFNSFGNSSSNAANLVIKAFTVLANTVRRTISIAVKAFDALGKAFLAPAKLVKTTVGTIVSSIEKISNAAKTMGTMVGKSFGSLLSITKDVATGILSSAKTIVSSFALVGTSGKVFSRLGSQLRSIIRIALPFTTIWGAINLTKQSVQLSSNLTEIQNVVRTTFGDMTQEVNKFAKSAVKELGMSELTFKQVASRYQAMGTAMGISSGQVKEATQFLQEHSEMYGKTADSMGDMSIELTRLAADIASFYDIDATDVADDLASIFTGQTRPLRQYGLDLTQATLQEWALKNGIDANIKSMSQAEKTLLRYQYVMAQTGAAQGDFQKTILTWANQTRILKESFKQVGSIIGEVIINAIKPFVIALNNALSSVISFTRKVADALGKIFGWTIQIDAGGVINDMEDASDSMEDFADDEDDAADSAKKLKKQLSVLPFDELNQLAKDLDETGKKKSGKDDGLDDAIETDGLSASFVKGEGLFDKYKSNIDSLYELGEYIGKVLKKTLGKIKWKKIYKKASGFGEGLASFLNGLVSVDGLFDKVGKSVAGGLNAAMKFVNGFGTTFDWKQFGKSLSDGIKSFISTYNWDLRVDNFNTFANGILDTIIAALDNVTAAEWREIPQKIADMVGAIDATGISWKLGKLANSLASSFYLVISDYDMWSGLGDKIAEGISGFFESMGEIDAGTGRNGWQALGGGISKSIVGIVDTIIYALNGAPWKNVGQAIADLIGGINFWEIGWDLGMLATSLAAALGEIVSNGNIWKNLGSNISSGINNFFYAMDWKKLGSDITQSISGILTSIIVALNEIDWTAAGQAVADFIGSIDFGQITWNLGKMASSLANAFYELVSNKNTWVNLGKALSGGLNGFFSSMNEVDAGTGRNGWQALGQSITNSITGIASSITTALQGVSWKNVGQAIADLIGGINFGEIGWNLGNLVNSLVDALYELASDKESWASLGTGMANGINNFFNTINWESVGLTLDGLFSGIVTFISNLAETGDWEEIGRNIGTALSGVDWGTHLLEAAKAIASILGDLLKGLGETTAGKWILGIAGAFTAVKLTTTIYTFVDGIATILSGSRNVRILTATMESLLGGATATAATTAATAVGGVGTAASTAAGGASLLHTGLSAIGGVGVITGLILAAKKISEISDAAKGGNGELSELGGVIDTISGKFSDGLSKSLFKAKEDLENANASTDEWAETLSQLFIDAGVGSEDLRDIYSEVAGSIGMSAGQTELFEQIIQRVSKEEAQWSEDQKQHALDNESAYSRLNEMLKTLQQEGIIPSQDHMRILQEELQKSETSGDNAATAFENLKTWIDDMNLSANDPDGIMNGVMNQALQDISGSADKAGTSVEDFSTTVGEETKTITGHFEQMSENSAKTVTEGVGTIKKKFDDDLKDAADSSKTHFGNIETSADDAATATENVGTKTDGSILKFIAFELKSLLMTGALGAIKSSAEDAEEKISDLNDTISDLSDNLPDYESDFKDMGTALINSMLSGISSKTSYDIVNSLSTVISNIKSAFSINNDMYSLGQSVGQSFANGLQNIHIKTPRMYISDWERHDLGNGGWMSTPNFSVQWLARGGLVTGLTNAILGENGRKEAVLPLESPRAMKAISAGLLSGMQNLSIGQYRLASLSDMAAPPDYSKAMSADAVQMRNTQIDNEDLMDAITGAVVTAMMNNQQNPINVTCYAELKTENDEVLARAVTRGQKSLDYRYNPTPKFGY